MSNTKSTDTTSRPATTCAPIGGIVITTISTPAGYIKAGENLMLQIQNKEGHIKVGSSNTKS